MADKMDIDAIMAELDDLPSGSSSSKPSSSKPSRFMFKPKGATTAPAKPSIKPKIETKDAIPTAPSSSSLITKPKAEIDANPKTEPDTNPIIEAHPMEEEEEEEDVVEREIDVFLTPFPLDQNETEIYVLQYPLRPNWQTYELERRCTEVRMMPKCKKMEVDFSIDDDRQTFDADMARPLGINKQTLKSISVPSAADYAVGILRNNQLHLNPINGVVQLRPVIRSDHQNRKRIAQQMDEKNVQDSMPSSSKMAKTEPVDSTQTENEDESWLPLEFLPEGSLLSEEYHKRMITTEHIKIQFGMTQSDYVGALCPGESISRRETKEAIIRELRKLPLEERLKKWFTEVSQLNRFDFIEYLLAPAVPVQEVLQQVQMLADLVRGVWVTKTALLYEGYEAVVRDYILLQFTKGNSIPYEKLRANLGRDVLGNKDLRPLLANLITSKPKDEKVKFKGSPDPTFSKRHADVVRRMEKAWSAREESILERVRELNKNGFSGTKRVFLKEDKENKVAENGLGQGDGRTAISANKLIVTPETQKHLVEALNKIFSEQKVRTIRSVVRDLRELAKRLSALPKTSDKNKHLIEGALCGASAAQTELQNIVKKVAVHIYGVYVMKAPKKEHLRNVLFLLFLEAKNPKAVLRKEEVMQRGQALFRREISESEYTQVVEEICITTDDGGLMLRAGG
ncbi:DNA-directed RNA polymerase III subunit RPC5 [Rhynchospora pubera]|uniref:DNA-directed RNA polymerase III subunit RPC5 n=1 Tax=Rhynchospora pubera TaxID=906938 RepID=A0AAV8D638_9POAL|nr:DNA-directed RNA polymerase III subunit RPC5 [Rhynchospora pubera]KAJ4815837.1 DNA-directed RNA polymerase III subunit RPC5 [Rhynchospora pubera]